jgi:sugar phosphate isomerase/epimerase
MDNMDPIALQLYSIKELTAVDFLGTLEKVAKIGYDGVEFAGYFDTSAKDLKRVLDGLNLRAAGSHVGIDDLKHNLEHSIAYALEIGNPYMICPGIPEEMRRNADDYKKLSDFFNKVGLRCKENGLQFGYHNHDFEFQQFDGEYGLDLITKQTESDLVFMELDTYWVEFSGLRSIDFIEKYADRCRILHIKDMKSAADKRNTEIGAGIMDFKAIIAAGQKQGVQWYTVEQEAFEIPQLTSIEASLKYLKSII